MSAEQAGGGTGSATRAPALPPTTKTDANLSICEKIRREATLTPSAIIDDLCESVPTRWICLGATYIEEVLEIARMLGRSHLLRFKVDC